VGLIGLSHHFQRSGKLVAAKVVKFAELLFFGCLGVRASDVRLSPMPDLERVRELLQRPDLSDDEAEVLRAAYRALAEVILETIERFSSADDGDRRDRAPNAVIDVDHASRS